ncbi:hypothetical protein V2W45_1470739 [Cenococcum geophilum]
MEGVKVIRFLTQPVLQEVAAARYILILYSPTEINRYAFCLGLELLKGRVSLNICSLGELIDIYYTYKATNRHDKIYTLLGISSDNLSVASLSPNYRNNKKMAIINSKGYILSQVSLVKRALKPIIIRPYKDHFAVIIIAATFSEAIGTESDSDRWLDFLHGFLLEEYKGLIKTNRRLEDYIRKVTGLYNVALILEDLEEYKEAKKRL